MKVRVFEYPKNPENELQDLKADVNRHSEIDYSYLLSEPRHRIFMSQEIYELQKSVDSYPTIREISHSLRGIEGYKYRYANRARDRTWLPFFTGQVYRYFMLSGEQKYVDFTRHIDDPDYLRFHTGERLLVRRVVSRRNRLQTMMMNDNFVVGKDLYSLLIHDPKYDIRYILALINSTLISYLYYTSSTVAQKDDFRQTTLDDIRNLHVAPGSDEEQQYIAKLANKLIALKQRIIRLNFTEDLSSYFHAQPHSQITLSNLLGWNSLKPGQQKRLLDPERRHGIVTKVDVKEEDDWLTFIISGKQSGNTEMELRDIELFSVEVENQYVRTFIKKLYPHRSLSASRKYILDVVLEQKLPMFVGDKQRNLAAMKKAVSSYQNACSTYQKLIDDMTDTEAQIDARIFAIYKISAPAAATVIESLDRDAAVGFSPSNPEIDLDVSYRQRVEHYMTNS